jgi:hypothetical protein
MTRSRIVLEHDRPGAYSGEVDVTECLKCFAVVRVDRIDQHCAESHEGSSLSGPSSSNEPPA